MSSWRAVEQAAPELAEGVRRRLLAHRHLTVATLRRDGSPRLSGTEVVFSSDDLWLAGMLGARRFDDLRRDARLALHSGSDDPPDWTADAKVSGRAAEVAEPDALAEFAAALPGGAPGSFELFRIDVEELVLVRLGEPADHLVVESWHEGRGLSRVTRA